jgi:hypothetical protein
MLLPINTSGQKPMKKLLVKRKAVHDEYSAKYGNIEMK